MSRSLKKPLPEVNGCIFIFFGSHSRWYPWTPKTMKHEAFKPPIYIYIWAITPKNDGILGSGGCKNLLVALLGSIIMYCIISNKSNILQTTQWVFFSAPVGTELFRKQQTQNCLLATTRLQSEVRPCWGDFQWKTSVAKGPVETFSSAYTSPARLNLYMFINL